MKTWYQHIVSVLFDDNGNGIFAGNGQSVIEKDIKADDVQKGAEITGCSISPLLAPPTIVDAFTYTEDEKFNNNNVV
jgi:hypothetical protein